LETALDLRSLAHLVRTYWLLIVALIAIAGITAFAVSSVWPRTYAAEAQVIVGSPLSGNVTDYNQLLAAEQLSRTYARAAQTTTVAARVIGRLGLDETPEELLRVVTATPSENTPIVIIAAQAPSAEAAAELANAFADELVTQSDAIQGTNQEVSRLLDEQIATVTAQIATVEGQLLELEGVEDPTAGDLARQTALSGQLVTLRSTLASLLATKGGLATNNVSVLDRAFPPTSPSSPRTLLNVALALILGSVLGLILAATIAMLDDTVKSGDDARETLGAPVLGAIGPMAGAVRRDPIYSLAMLLYPRSPAAEAFRSLRASVGYLGGGTAPVRTLMISSAGPGEGKTTVASNVALAFAQSGTRTILDADLRKPGVHSVFKLGNNAGLSTVLKPEPGEMAPFLQSTDDPRLMVLTAGPIPPNPADLLGSPRMVQLVGHLLDRAEIVVFDSAPIRTAADTAVLARQVDGVLLVVATGETRRNAARASAEALTRVGARVLGVALNRRRPGRDAAREEMQPYGNAGEAAGAAADPEAARG
jgi:capsular exopolysaccharide synthesis family protein